MAGLSRIAFTGLLVTLITVSVGLAGSDNSTTNATVMKGLSSMPLAFTENQGQWDEKVLFRANAGGATMWFSRDGAYYQFTRHIPTSNYSSVIASDLRNRGNLPHSLNVTLSGVEGRPNQPDSLETIMIKANFVGSNPNPHMVGENMLEYKCNYFLGNDPAKWRTDVPNYSAILYEGVYPGIDLKYYGNGKQMEYDFIVSPGSDPSQIMVRYEGAKSLSVDAAGRLVVETDWGEVIEQRPVVYQVSGGDHVSLVGEYVLKGDRTFGFELGSGYDRNLPVVIDPVLEYSTYLGGGDTDYGYGIAADASGAAYVTGVTKSSDFPTENPYQTDQLGSDVFVTKLSSSGNSLVYSTYLGGSDGDHGRGITVDASGAVYVTGSTGSTDFPTENPYQTDQGKSDVFVTKLGSSGNSLVYSTYLGGSDTDNGSNIAVDASGAAYVTGRTESTNFPTENPFQTNLRGYSDAFVTKLSSSGNNLVYSTYLGGSIDERGYGIAVDASGAAYVTGEVKWSTSFPTENPYQANLLGHTDAFVTKLSNSGSSLVYSTYLGGSNGDLGYGIAVDASGAAYVTGKTLSPDFPTENPYQSPPGDFNPDAFVTKLSSSGSSLVYSTYFGGSSVDEGHGIAVDASGVAYVTGTTLSTDFPTENPFQTYQGHFDVFVTKLGSAGSSLVYSTYLGGSNSDLGYGIAVDASGAAYVTGQTYSTDFPTENPYQTDQNSYDAFIAKFVEPYCNHDGIRGDADYSGTLDVGDLTFLVAYLFQGGDAPPCPEEGDVDGSGFTDVGDLTALVSYLFQGGTAPAPCP
ncbi:MAG: SBBP repeat-containing protein [bacterium]